METPVACAAWANSHGTSRAVNDAPLATLRPFRKMGHAFFAALDLKRINGLERLFVATAAQVNDERVNEPASEAHFVFLLHFFASLSSLSLCLCLFL